ncbi:hypothetical protein Q8A67_015921 [Cirrhinus molitorella]|uniref:Uncharacterized protein n=1 Tax=Cirrhinus molitorella TaxID=172907 RepID=A0AA88PFN5_9TELE|nr:hypothetical protein Q8A67_015921 [Cirrhinus molitorella]
MGGRVQNHNQKRQRLTSDFSAVALGEVACNWTNSSPNAPAARCSALHHRNDLHLPPRLHNKTQISGTVKAPVKPQTLKLHRKLLPKVWTPVDSYTQSEADAVCDNRGGWSLVQHSRVLTRPLQAGSRLWEYAFWEMRYGAALVVSWGDGWPQAECSRCHDGFDGLSVTPCFYRHLHSSGRRTGHRWDRLTEARAVLLHRLSASPVCLNMLLDPSLSGRSRFCMRLSHRAALAFFLRPLKKKRSVALIRSWPGRVCPSSGEEEGRISNQRCSDQTGVTLSPVRPESKAGFISERSRRGPAQETHVQVQTQHQKKEQELFLVL